MSDRINLSIPFATFGAIPFEQCQAALETSDLHKPTYHLVLYRLFGFLDWSKTIRIGEHDFMLGWTCVLSEDVLASKLGCCVKTVRKALHALCDAEILKREKVGKCFRYHIALFDNAIAWLKENPPETIRIEYLKSKPAAVKHTTRQNKSAKSADSQDLLIEEAPPEPGTAAGEGGLKTSQKAKPPDSALSENSSGSPESARQKSTLPDPTPRSKVSHSAAPPLDIAPNGYIESTVEELTDAKRMNAAPTDHNSDYNPNLEAYILIFKPDAPVSTTWKMKEPAEELDREIKALIAKHELSISPLQFFERVHAETQRRVASEEIDPPVSLRFYIEVPDGKKIMQACITQQQISKSAESNIESTKAYLDDLKSKRSKSSQHVDIQALLAKASTPEAIEAARVARKERNR